MSLGPVTQSQNNVINAIFSASQRTGADFDYLVRTGMRESGLRTHVNSSTSTAAGPFQFIEQTWLSTLKEHGGEHGFGTQAAAIEQGSNGRYQIADETQRQEILALRHDARASAIMAGELTNDAARGLERALGRDLRPNEPYVAHFMGQGGATRLIREVDANPETIASDLFPRAANANPSIFNNADGSARTVTEVYANLTTLPEVDRSRATSTPTPTIARPEPAAPPAQIRVPVEGSLTQHYAMVSSPGSFTSLLTPQVLEILSLLNPSAALRNDDGEDDANDNRSRVMQDV